MSRRLEVALVGAGAIGRVHLEAIAASPRATLTAVCDADEGRARAQAPAGTPIYRDVETMLRERHVDAAVVATPPSSHRAIAEQLAAAGVHVLCEKPFAITASDARAMLAAARSAGTVMTMSAKFRFVEGVRQARAAIAAGAIGEPRLIENVFTASTPMAQRWHSDPQVSGGGVVIDNGTHAVDIFRYLCGPLASVRAIEYPRYQALAVEDTAELIARSLTGVVAVSNLSWTIVKHDPYYLHVHGSEGCIELGWQSSRIRRGDGDWQQWSGYSRAEAFGALFENFAGAIAGDCPVELAPADVLGSVSAIEAAYRAMARPGWKKVAA